MIKFFRKIRYNLMETGKTGKYFKYAIGEIILVVIGILIALQVSDWNEQKKSIQQTNIYLHDLKNEIETNVMVMNNSIDALEKMKKLISEYHSLLITETPEEVTDATISEIILKINPVTPFKPLQVVLNDFVNSGNIKNINNNSLKHNIPILESVYHAYYNEFTDGNNHVSIKILTYMSNHSDFTKTSNLIGNYNVKQSPFKHDREAFINNRNFSNQLILYLGYLNYIQDIVIEKRGFLKSLNKDITSYLNK